ncbi:MAG: L,D-transpeptidase [Streptosporangiaceae bacterium]
MGTSPAAKQAEPVNRMDLLRRQRTAGGLQRLPGEPTPTGRTFLLASLSPAQPAYSPLILPLGVHSATLDTFGGGPGTVALHGWPDKTVFGHAVSHGCVRVPAAALRVLSRIPLGSPVMITS